MSGPVLDIGHLAVIGALARHGRLSDAARDLHVTPSALSHRIREAEKRLGLMLYVRANKRLEPTPAADHLAEVATRIVDELARAESDARRMTGAVRHVVRLAVESYSSYHWLPGFVRHVRANAAGIELQVMGSTGADPRSGVATGRLDVALVSGDYPALGLVAAKLFDDELVFILPPGHHLAGRDYIDGPDIAGEDFITYTRAPEPDREFALLFRPTSSYPSWVETVELPEAIVEMVAAGLGTSVLARWAVQRAIDGGRVAASRVGPEGIVVPWYAVHRDADGPDSPSAAIAELLVRWCGENGGSL